MKVVASTGKLTLEDSDGEDAIVVTNGPYMIRRVNNQAYVEVSGAWGLQRIKVSEVTHLGGSAFSGDSQDLMDALVTGLSP